MCIYNWGITHHFSNLTACFFSKRYTTPPPLCFILLIIKFPPSRKPYLLPCVIASIPDLLIFTLKYALNSSFLDAVVHVLYLADCLMYCMILTLNSDEGLRSDWQLRRKCTASIPCHWKSFLVLFLQPHVISYPKSCGDFKTFRLEILWLN